MLHTWRWYGPQDPVSLPDIRQAGVRTIVTALHDVPNGAIWSVDTIQEMQHAVAEEHPVQLRWQVVESVPIHHAIKLGAPGRDEYIDNYRQTLRNLASCGIHVVCYNFMPVVDWTRTDLKFEMPDGALALRFDRKAMAAFDLFILQRSGAEEEYEQAVIHDTHERYRSMTVHEREVLSDTILAGLPGSEEAYTLSSFKDAVAAFNDLGADGLRASLAVFLQQVIPAAEEVGVRMAIHPDDPPFPMLGLPRIVSTEEDVRTLFSAVDIPENGLTFCTGSFGVRPDNDLEGMVRRLGDRIHFTHLRSTRREPDGSFYEADHLDGDVDMYAVVRAIVEEEARREEAGRADAQIPMRPDHGHQVLDDLTKRINPGYSAIGRLRGLAELRGLERAIRRGLEEEHRGNG